jgi:small GTP-binding protein
MKKGKVVLVGSAHTGKTSIIKRLIYREFSPHTMPSTQPAFFQKKMNLEGRPFTLEIWDTAGQEQYHALSPMFYRDADAGIVVFDLTDQPTFKQAQHWVSELRQARGDAIQIAVCGNKTDLPSVRTVTLEQIAQFASGLNAKSFETSAKTGENIDLMFNQIAQGLMSRAGPVASPKSTTKRRSNVRFDEAPPREEGCC